MGPLGGRRTLASTTARSGALDLFVIWLKYVAASGDVETKKVNRASVPGPPKTQFRARRPPAHREYSSVRICWRGHPMAGSGGPLSRKVRARSWSQQGVAPFGTKEPTDQSEPTSIWVLKVRPVVLCFWLASAPARQACRRVTVQAHWLMPIPGCATLRPGWRFGPGTSQDIEALGAEHFHRRRMTCYPPER
jgi:hypothetical protein